MKKIFFIVAVFCLCSVSFAQSNITLELKDLGYIIDIKYDNEYLDLGSLKLVIKTLTDSSV